MGKRKNEARRKKTSYVGMRDRYGHMPIQNGEHGRSQKGCYGGTPGFKGGVYSKEWEDK